MNDRWLDVATPGDLEALAAALGAGSLTRPYLSPSVKLAGADGAQAFLASLGDTDPRVISWMLRRLAGERRATGDRFAQAAQLVWSGAAEGEHAIRDTRVVLDELFRNAMRSVLLSTYVLYDGRAVLGRLADRVREVPALHVEIYVNLPADEALDERQRARAFLDRFRTEHWPSDLRVPAIYFDHASETEDGKRIALHAKSVVVDDRWAFITSANFTEAAQERNIEAGVLLDHPDLARALTFRFRGLRDTGRLRRIE